MLKCPVVSHLINSADSQVTWEPEGAACVSALQDFHAERPNRTSWCPRPATSTIAPPPPSQFRQSRGVRSPRDFVPVVLALPVLRSNSQEVVSKCIIQNRCSRALCGRTKPTHFWQCTYLVCKYKLRSCSVSVLLLPAPPCRSWHQQRGEIREFTHIPPNSPRLRNTCESDWLIYHSNQILSLWETFGTVAVSTAVRRLPRLALWGCESVKCGHSPRCQCNPEIFSPPACSRLI